MLKAQEGEILKTAFLANLSHEIRTPLNGILGFTDVLSYYLEDNNELTQYLNLIKTSGKQLLGILSDVLVMSKIEAGQIELKKDNIYLDKFLQEIYIFFLPQAKIHALKLVIEKDNTRETCCVIADAIRLRQVIDNLINNALKFTKEGEIKFGYLIKEDQIHFFVKDTGIGIDPEHHDKIFERFQQVEQDYLKNFNGIGLGLAICKSLVEIMGGRIGIKSEINKGSEFYFSIPYIKGTNIEENINEKINKKKNAISKILIVDDEPINLILLEEIIKTEFGDVILTATNGKEAVKQCLNNENINLVLIDIKMPVMNGIEATKIIKEKRPELIIIAQSAYNAQSDKKNAIQAGCNDFISKPIQKYDLVNMIKKHIFFEVEIM